MWARSVEEGNAAEMKPMQSGSHHVKSGKELPRIGTDRPGTWLARVSERFDRVNWKTFTVGERKEALLFVYDTDSPRFLDVVQHVLQHYPGCDIEDLEGERNILLILPTNLSLRVARSYCSGTLTFRHMPSLMKTDIPPQKLEKLMRASLEGCRRRKKRKSKSISEEVAEPRVAAGTRMGGAQRERGASVSERESGAFATNKVGMGKFGEIRDDGGGGGGHGSVGGAMRYDGDEEGGIKSDSAAPMSTLQESDPRYMSLKVDRMLSQPELPAEEVKDLVDSVQDDDYRKGVKYLDSKFQRMLSICDTRVNLNECSSKCHGTVLHTAARFGLTESAREILAQGYCNMLQETHGDDPNSWPLTFAVRARKWATVKVILETLSTGQRQAQIRALPQRIDYKDIVHKLSERRKPFWPLRLFHREDLQEKLRNEGRLFFLRCVLDTMIKGCEIDPSLLFDEANEVQEEDDSTDDSTKGGSGVIVGGGLTTDSNASTTSEKKTLYRLISESDVEELKFHPSFATVVEHKWRHGYVYSHGILFLLYVAYVILFTSALALAAKSSDPRTYNSPTDFVRLFLLEIVCFLYILVVLVVECILLFDEIYHHFQASKKLMDLLEEKVTWYSFFEVLRYSSTLLIIPLRIADDPHQWWVVSLAIILSGLRLFYYATVLPFMGQYVGTLILLVKHDLPRLFGVFIVINFSFGTGLYFALVGQNNDGNIDTENDNITSGVYRFWFTGVQMVIEGSVLTYLGDNGFNFPGRVVYWLFVFCVTVAFAAILIAQFEISFNTLSNRASMNVIIKKAEIMHKMDRIREAFGSVRQGLSLCCIKRSFGEESEKGKESEKSHDNIRRQAWDVGSEDLDVKDYVVAELSRKLAENDKRVQTLENKLDKIYELLVSSSSSSKKK